MRAFFKELLFQFHCWRLERMRARWRAKHYPTAMLPRQGGFSLIELAIVVSIIGLALGFAIPAYQDFITKSKVTEGYNLGSGVETQIADAWNTGGLEGITALADTYVFGPSQYVACVAFNDGTGAAVPGQCTGNQSVAGMPGAITISLAPATTGVSSSNTQLVLTPSVNNGTGFVPLAAGVGGTLSWACASLTSVTATAAGLPATVSVNGLLPKYVSTQCK